jgi:hypothetical protein
MRRWKSSQRACAIAMSATGTFWVRFRKICRRTKRFRDRR